MRRTTVASIVLALLLCAAVPAATAATGATDTRTASTTAPPEPPEVQWNQTYGGPGTDRLSGVTKVSDGYVLTGWAAGDGEADGWALKIDKQGNTVWEKRLGGGAFDKLYEALPTDDGYLLVGENGTSSASHGWVVEIDEQGEVQSQRNYGDDGGFWTGAKTDDGYVLGGWVRGEDGRDGWAMKLDASGETAWEKTFTGLDGTSTEYVKSVVPRGGNYLFVGVSEGQNGTSALAARTDSAGNVDWENTYSHGDAAVSDVWDATFSGSGYVLAGETGTEELEGRDAWILRIGSDGAVDWEQTYGGEKYDWVDGVIPTADGAYMFTGGTQTGDFGSADGYMIKTDTRGNEQFTMSFGSNLWDKSWPLVEAHDGGYLLVGETSGFDAQDKDGWVVKVGSLGSLGPTETPDMEAAQGSDGTVESEKPGSTATTTGTEGQPGFTALSALAALTALLVGAVARRRR